MKLLKLAGIVFFSLVVIIFYQNITIQTSYYEIVSKDIPKKFQNFRIVQLSDIHSIRSERQHKLLVKRVQDASPNIIVLTGDLIDSNYYEKQMHKDSKEPIELSTLNFLEDIVQMAPVYYVYGNHEHVLTIDGAATEFQLAVEKLGIQMLNNSSVLIEEDGEYIQLLGIQDPYTLRNAGQVTEKILVNEMLKKVTVNMEADYSILLSHRPEYFDIYKEYPIDLVLAGHAHGGQIRLPFTEGIYAPNQGFFPTYTSGIHSSNQTNMIISRGIGNSTVPVRVFNTPEVVVIDLFKK